MFNDKPIINNLLDLDFYKLTMQQFVFHNYPREMVKYAFKNRTTKVRLADEIDQGKLREELDNIKSLRFPGYGIDYLRTLKIGDDSRMFSEDYLDFLSEMKMPGYYLGKEDGQYIIEACGTWPETILWETLIMSTVNTLYNKSYFMKNYLTDWQVWETGVSRLYDKIEMLKGLPAGLISDFSTRRRASAFWQPYVVEIMKRMLPNKFMGTSNVWLSMRYGMQPIGTMAHELFMVMARLNGDRDEDILASHNLVLRKWWDEYGYDLSIALTDTFGSDFFLRDMTEAQARKWKGLRHDSGDAVAFGEKVIRFYENYGIDPREKLIVFSDGLDAKPIMELAHHFKGRIKLAFGWGTNLGNDVGIPTLSIVVKAVEVAGHGMTVKLSDNLAKAMGTPEDVERFKKIFGYAGDNYVECEV